MLGKSLVEQDAGRRVDLMDFLNPHLAPSIVKGDGAATTIGANDCAGVEIGLGDAVQIIPRDYRDHATWRRRLGEATAPIIK